MKVAHAQDNVIASQGLKETGGFKIAATGHAFQMLSSGLYSDKVRAVLREIGCNASDAHIEAGCPQRPFRAKIPNPLDDQFYVQDWGPGLSHEAVMNLYTTYFASTKQTSNDFTGAFGLGSKSPFSYIDSFTVVSVHGGRKRTYTLYLDNEGSPTVSLMAEEAPDPDWQSGVRVGFAVKPEDFDEFQTKAQDVFQWFKTPPEMRGVKPIEPIAYRSDREEFRLLKDGGDPHVLMGNVAYPLDFSKCGVEDPWDPKKGLLLRNYATCARGFVLVMPIGSVRVAASREALQYDPASVKALQERLELSMRKLGNDVVERLEAALGGGWIELCKVRDLIEQGLPGSLRYDFGTFGRALGLSDGKVEQLKPFISKAEIEIPAAAGVKTSCRLVHVKDYGKGRGKPTSSWIQAGRSINMGKAKISVDLSTVIAAGDCGFAVPRARKAVREGKYKQVLVFGRSDANKATDEACHEEAHEVAKLLGGVPVIDLQSLEAPPRSAGSAKKRPKGWKPTLPAQEVTCYIMGNKEKKLLPDVPDQLFACLSIRSAWGNVRKFHRMFEKSASDDVSIPWDQWKEMWGHYVTLQTTLELPKSPTSFAVLRGKDIRSIRLPELGWTRAYDAVKAYVARPEVAARLRKLVKKRVLVAPAEIRWVHDEWMSAMACLLADGGLPPALRPELERLDLWDTVEMMARNRSKGVDKSTPREITAYQRLAMHFELQDELAATVKDSLTVADVNAAFSRRFPRARSTVDANVLHSMDARDRLEFIKYILGRHD